MIDLSLRFYGDLNRLLSGPDSGPTIRRSLPAPTSSKDLIEGCGIPHTEIDLILVNSQPSDFSYLTADGDHFSIYPIFTHLEIPKHKRLQQITFNKPIFLVDVNLGKLARYLRIAGFDSAYENNAKDDELIDQMQQENRILLTRDRKLLMHSEVKTGFLPRSDDPTEQLEEVLQRFQLQNKVTLFTRCPRCNGSLKKVDKKQIIGELEPLTKRYFNTFAQCADCGQIYWPGSHHQHLKNKLKNILNRLKN